MDLLVQENSIKIVIRLTGYFLLRPLMNEPFVSENLTSDLVGCACMCVDMFAGVCVFMRMCVFCHGFADTFHEDGANPKSE